MMYAEDRRARYSLITPEGVDLQLTLADRTTRMGAVLIDLAIITALLIAFTLLIVFGGMASGVAGSFPVVLVVVWIVGAFLLRAFYFTVMEAGPRAATFGKRMMGIRVASADGRPLTGYAVFVRNVMREIEVFVPLSFFLTLGSQAGVDGIIVLFGAIWSAALLAVPFISPNRMRGGDLIAGTVVIELPKLKLATDTAATKAEAENALAFNSAQLDVYGQSELQVLENILRHRHEDTITAVAAQIRKKISWETTPGETDLAFLQAYYNGVRQHLEQRLLFGRRRRDKHDQ
ncbi:MAG: RDD family protein [Pseudomonadota bacterium]